jgi:hypothetical protein
MVICAQTTCGICVDLQFDESSSVVHAARPRQVEALVACRPKLDELIKLRLLANHRLIDTTTMESMFDLR